MKTFILAIALLISTVSVSGAYTAPDITNSKLGYFPHSENVQPMVSDGELTFWFFSDYMEPSNFSDDVFLQSGNKTYFNFHLLHTVRLNGDIIQQNQQILFNKLQKIEDKLNNIQPGGDVSGDQISFSYALAGLLSGFLFWMLLSRP